MSFNWSDWGERHGRWVGITTWAECLAVERCGKQPRYNPHARPRSIRVQRVTLQTLIDNRILQVQTVILSRRRRLPAHGLHCFKALTIQRFTWRERDHPPTRFLRIQETLNADQRVCPAGSSLSRFRPMRRRRHARLGITDWTISTVPPG